MKGIGIAWANEGKDMYSESVACSEQARGLLLVGGKLLRVAFEPRGKP